MRKIFVLLTVVLFAILISASASASNNSNVAYTWTITNLGQRYGAGGPLFTDEQAPAR